MSNRNYIEPAAVALAELRKLEPAFWRIIITAHTKGFDGSESECECEIFYTALITYEQKRFRAPTLEDAMAQARKWKESQS